MWRIKIFIITVKIFVHPITSDCHHVSRILKQMEWEKEKSSVTHQIGLYNMFSLPETHRRWSQKQFCFDRHIRRRPCHDDGKLSLKHERRNQTLNSKPWQQKSASTMHRLQSQGIPSMRTRNPRWPMADRAAWKVIKMRLVALTIRVCLPSVPHSLRYTSTIVSLSAALSSTLNQHAHRRVLHRIIWSWYTGCWLANCCIWYSEEGTGRGRSPPRPPLVVPNVTSHPSTASVPIAVLLHNGPLLCGFNVAIKGLSKHLTTKNSALAIWVNFPAVRWFIGHSCDSAIKQWICTRNTPVDTQSNILEEEQEQWKSELCSAILCLYWPHVKRFVYGSYCWFERGKFSLIPDQLTRLFTTLI